MKTNITLWTNEEGEEKQLDIIFDAKFNPFKIGDIIYVGFDELTIYREEKHLTVEQIKGSILTIEYHLKKSN